MSRHQPALDDRPGPQLGQLLACGLRCDFGGVTAVAGVTLGIKAGETLGIIGPNGSGKTTLINLLTGFAKPSEGRIWLHERACTNWSPTRRARAGIARTFQHIRLFEGMTVSENVEVGVVATGRRGRASARRTARLALDQLKITQYAHRDTRGLPYGVRRRAEIARALGMRPTFLLLDEPAAGMDERESADLIDALAPLPSERELGMLVVEHDFRVIEALCDQVMVIDSGAVLAVGSAEQVSRDPLVLDAYLGTDGASLPSYATSERGINESVRP